MLRSCAGGHAHPGAESHTSEPLNTPPSHRGIDQLLHLSQWRGQGGGGDALGSAAASAAGAAVNDTAAADDMHGEHAIARPSPHGSRWGWRDCALGSTAVTMVSRCWMVEGLAVPLSKPELRRGVAEGRYTVFHEAQVRLCRAPAALPCCVGVPRTCTSAPSRPRIPAKLPCEASFQRQCFLSMEAAHH